MANRRGPRDFERLALPHLDAAYSLARWLMQNESDAEDVVQDAYLRAYKYFAGFLGGNFRAWLFAIVRHAAYDWMRRNRSQEIALDVDVDGVSETSDDAAVSDNPETALLRKADHHMINEMIASLPPVLREVVVLRELQELSYQEIAEIIEVPIGTVMSRLSRARVRLIADGQRRLKETDNG
ncbi:MAG TPA: sigma-70 family RNA polymerase sigma factor [Alphaproteobacteria bacterium]